MRDEFYISHSIILAYNNLKKFEFRIRKLDKEIPR